MRLVCYNVRFNETKDVCEVRLDDTLTGDYFALIYSNGKIQIDLWNCNKEQAKEFICKLIDEAEVVE